MRLLNPYGDRLRPLTWALYCCTLCVTSRYLLFRSSRLESRSGRIIICGPSKLVIDWMLEVVWGCPS